VRDVTVGSVGRESVHTVTPGGVAGFTLQYKQRFSMGLEGAINYANIGIDNTTNTVYYNAFGSLSVNF
jgi:hypothetical protein